METRKSKYDEDLHGSDVENVVLIHRVFDLPVSKVWRALTVAEEFEKWWDQKGLPVTPKKWKQE